MRQCGACNLCCILINIPVLKKPAGVPCQHLAEVGCGIYEDRPGCCRAFECHWLITPSMSHELRPDLCGVIFQSISPNAMMGAAARGNLAPWRSKAVIKFIRRLIKTGWGVVLADGDTRTGTYAMNALVADMANRDFAEHIEKVKAMRAQVVVQSEEHRPVKPEDGEHSPAI